MMIKKFLFAAALLSLALATSCAKGGSGPCAENCPAITVSDGNLNAAYPGQTVQFTATVTGTTSTAVTWSLSGSACSGSSNPCGTIDSTTGLYTAPATPPSPSEVTITATLQSDTSVTGTGQINVILVTVVVTPLTVSVGENLVEQLTAAAIPDDAPQTFTWSCTPTGSCGTLNCGSGNPTCSNPASGLVTYTAPASTGPVVISATSTVTQSPAAVGQAKVSVVPSRLPSGSYTFQFSGYDASGHAVATAGTLTVGTNGSISSGVEDVVDNGTYNQYTTISGGYSANSVNNNLGTLTITAQSGPSYTYTAVATSDGTMRMIESDSTGSGVLVKSASSTAFNAGAQTFAFGLTGLDSSGNRVGYAGLVPMTPSGNGGNIASGLLDVNDNTNADLFCGSPPCAVTGTYTLNANGVWQMQLTAGAHTLNFDFFVAGGATQTKTGASPLTLYAVSTDPIAANPVVSGSMVYQVPMTYNNAAFNGTSISNLAGLMTTASAAVAGTSNVALIIGTTDGTSSGTGGTGGFTGTSDQNDNGTTVSITSTAPFSYNYVATNSNTGRYTFQMLGNPNASPAVSPLTFILYASGANRGFLLDESTAAVMTGTMNPQSTLNNLLFAVDELPGAYAAATVPGGASSVAPLVQNFVLSETGSGSSPDVVAGAQNPNNISLAGTYTLSDNSTGGGTGTITLSSSPPPAGANYVIYVIDASGVAGTSEVVITDFMMMGLTSGAPSSIVFAQQ